MSDNLRARNTIAGFAAPTCGVHAVLFYGAQGAPVIPLAEELALGWLCTKIQEGKPCGQCRSCLAFQKGGHVDLKRVIPKGPSAIIKISSITIREKEKKDEEPEQPLQEFFRTPPLSARRKVVIIEAADRMNHEAANSLLKILEEPHDYARLILTTQELSDLLPTILSRCVSVPVELPPFEGDRSRSFAMINELAKSISPRTPNRALHLSENLREVCAVIEGEEKIGVRNAQTRALLCFAQAIYEQHPEKPEWTHLAIDAHRRVVGNGSAGLVFDALFAGLTA